MKNPEIFLVLADEDESTEIVSVKATEKEAEQVLKEMQKQDNEEWYEFRIEKWNIGEVRTPYFLKQDE